MNPDRTPGFRETGMTQPSHEPTLQERLRDRLVQWIRDDDIPVKTLPPKDEIAWARVAEIDVGGGDILKVVICQLQDKPDLILLEGYIEVSPAQQTRLNTMPNRPRDEFLTELRIEFLRAGYMYANLEAPLDEFRIQKQCYLEGLTKDVFMQRFLEMKLGMLLAGELVIRRLGKR
jgi:hypothetical protein